MLLLFHIPVYIVTHSRWIEWMMMAVWWESADEETDEELYSTAETLTKDLTVSCHSEAHQPAAGKTHHALG